MTLSWHGMTAAQKTKVPKSETPPDLTSRSCIFVGPNTIQPADSRIVRARG